MGEIINMCGSENQKQYKFWADKWNLYCRHCLIFYGHPLKMDSELTVIP